RRLLSRPCNVTAHWRAARVGRDWRKAELLRRRWCNVARCCAQAVRGLFLGRAWLQRRRRLEGPWNAVELKMLVPRRRHRQCVGEHGRLVWGSIEPECVLRKEVYACRKNNPPLSRAHEDMAVCALSKLEPIGIIERAAA